MIVPNDIYICDGDEKWEVEWAAEVEDKGMRNVTE